MALNSSSHARTVDGSCGVRVYTTTSGSARQDQLWFEKFDRTASSTGWCVCVACVVCVVCVCVARVWRVRVVCVCVCVACACGVWCVCLCVV